MSVVAIRGGITVDNNTEYDIINNTKKLITAIEEANNIDREKVISIIFSSTKDLDAAYPAKAARKLGYTEAGLMCFGEMDVANSLPKCIRVMILYNDNICQDEIKHIYLKGAKKLRPDLSN